MKVFELLKTIAERLSRSDTPQLDAQVLMAHILQKPRSWVMAHGDEEVNQNQTRHIEAAIEKLEAGEPLPYVLGEWEFFGLQFHITNDVLIPRPETELLVEKALAHLQTSETKNLVDVGTGSGAIAISIAVNLPQANILATDISPAALAIAKRNAQKHNAQSRIKFVECDLLPTFNLSTFQPFHLLCANLPYIPTETMRGLEIYGREPTLALDGGFDGLVLFRKLFKLAPAVLAPNAVVLLEIESTLGAQIIHLASSYFPNAKINLHSDLANKDRLVEIQT